MHWRQYPTILNTFGALTSIPKPESAGEYRTAPEMCWKFWKIVAYWQNSGAHINAPNLFKFSGIDKILVFTSMHQMYSKFSELSHIRMSIPEVRILWHLSQDEDFTIGSLSISAIQHSSTLSRNAVYLNISSLLSRGLVWIHRLYTSSLLRLRYDVLDTLK